MSKNMLWIDDPLNVLFDLKRIVPDRSDSFNEQINAFTRFILLYGGILSVYKKSLDPLVFAMLMSIGVLVLVWVMKHYNKKNTEQPYPVESDITREKTLDNPFANPIIGSVNTNTNKTNKDADELFVQNLPLDEWDIYGKNNSQRQFFSVPVNDQTSFAKWLYDPGEVCKTTTTRCAGY